MSAEAIPAVHWTIPATNAAVGPARDRVLALALSWRYRLDEVEQQMLLLLVSEMVTNACLYGRAAGDSNPRIAIGMKPSKGGILVVVRDHSRTAPSHLTADPGDEHGRGVSIMQELAASSGWFPVADGKEVYAVMAAARIPSRAQRRAALLGRLRAMRPRLRVHPADAMLAA